VDKPRKSDDAPIRFLDQSELEAVLRATPETDRALYITAAMTGLRRGELLALRWRDIDWIAQRVRVRENYVRGEYGAPKSKRSTPSVPLANRVAGELERHFQRSSFQKDDQLVFPNAAGGPRDTTTLRRRFERAVKKAKVRKVRFHDLRHTFGTRMAAAGVSMRTLQEWMGHRDFSTTLRYADYQPAAGEAALVERAFGAGTETGTEVSDGEHHSAPPSVPENT
jgi:integrase